MNDYNNDLPDWLQDAESDNAPGKPDEIEAPTEGPPPDWMRVATSGGGSSLTEDNIPDWLKAVRAGQGISKKEGGMEKDEPKPAASESEDDNGGLSDLERLLAEEGIDLNSVSEDRPEEAKGMSTRDWLIASSDDEMIRRRIGSEPQAEEPPPAPEPAPEPEPAAPSESFVMDDKMIVEEDLPDWLQEISEDEELAVEEYEPAGSDLVSDVEPAMPPIASAEEEDKMVVEEGLPDWLRDVSDEFPAEEEPISAIPDFSEEAVAPAEPEPALPSAYRDDKMVVEEDLPDWLREVSDEIPDTSAAVERSDVSMVGLPISDTIGVDDEDLPDWLKETGEEAEEEEPVISLQQASETIALEDDLPDWLRQVEETSVDLAAVADEADQGEPAFSSAAADEELPSWLREVEESSAEAESFMLDFEETVEAPGLAAADSSLFDEEDLPDWLRDIQEEEEELEEPVAGLAEEKKIAVAATTDQEDLFVDEEGLPDWLKEVQEGEAETEAELLPDWLEEIQEEERVDRPVTEQETTVGVVASAEDIVDEEGLPDWLQEVQADEEAFEPSEPSPEPFADVYEEEEEELLVEDLSVEEELPDWLQEVQEQEAAEEAEAAPVAEPVATPVTSEDADILTAEADLPEWLRDVEEEIEPEIEAETEVEAEPIPSIEPTEQPEPVEAESTVAAEQEEIQEPEPSAPMPAPAAAPTPTPSGLPDWLQKLREGQAEEAAARAPALQPQPMAEARATTPVSRPESVASAVVEIQMEDQDLPADAEKRLKLARAARDEGNLEEAVRIYDSLVTSGVYLDRVIEDMQLAIKSYPSNYLLFQLMGDAMMKDGRLQSALDAYREALAKL